MAKQKQTPKAQPQRPAAKPQPSPAASAKVMPSATGMPSDKIFIIILAAIALLVNIRTISYGYTLDDPFFTKENPNVSRGIAAIHDFFTHAAYYKVYANHDASYRPFMLASFALEKDLFGFDPKIGHLINLLLFALEIGILFVLLRRVFRTMSPYIPFFITLLFALHPIHTEVIASIKSRDEIMGLLFSLLCLWQTMKYADTDKMKHLIFSGLWFFCALMSKETPIALVLIAPLTIYFFRDVPVAKIIRATIPYVVVAVLYMGMRAAFIESDGQKVVILVNNNALMAASNYGEKLATLLYIQLKYLILLVFPHPLSYDYSFNQIPIISFANVKAIAALAVIAGMLVYAIRGFRRKDVFAYCIIFYGLSTVITSNLLVDIGATMAERFIFTASLAYCIAIVLIIARLLKADTLTASWVSARPLALSLAAVAVLYAGKTMARNEVWQDNTTLYESGMETAPDSWRAQYLLAVECTKQIQKETAPAAKHDLYVKAIEHYNKSLQILPNNVDVYFLEGYAYDFAGQLDSAIVCYAKTVQLSPARNDARSNLGAMLLRKGALDSAIKVLTEAVAKDTLNTGAMSNLAASYGNKGDFRQAEAIYLRALRINPNQPPNVFQSMANIYHFSGDSVNAPIYRKKVNEALLREQQNKAAE